jgi:hypothetical protein
MSYDSKLIDVLRNSKHAIPIIQSIHLFGITLLLASMVILNFRMLGIGLQEIRLEVLAKQVWSWGTAGLVLAVLHGIEAAIWAAAYVWLGALNLPEDAILYSVDSMTTRGASGLMLEPHWQIMGALEAANGMLLFGISTAYIFAVMLQWWPVLSGLLNRAPDVP